MRRAGLLLMLTLGCGSVPAGNAIDGVVRAIDCLGSPTCRQRPATVGARVRGRVVIEGPAGFQPVAYTRLNLVRRGKTVAGASSDRSGAFLFQRDIDDGLYDLVIDSERYEGQLAVELNGGASEILLTAKPRASVPR